MANPKDRRKNAPKNQPRTQTLAVRKKAQIPLFVANPNTAVRNKSFHEKSIPADHASPTHTEISENTVRTILATRLRPQTSDYGGPVFPGFSAEVDPRDPPRSPGPALHFKLHEKSAPQTDYDAISRHPKNPARLPSGTQLGSLAGFAGYRDMALESVCVADFSCKLVCGAGPGDLGWSRGSTSAENPRKTGRKSPVAQRRFSLDPGVLLKDPGIL